MISSCIGADHHRVRVVERDLCELRVELRVDHRRDLHAYRERQRDVDRARAPEPQLLGAGRAGDHREPRQHVVLDVHAERVRRRVGVEQRVAGAGPRDDLELAIDGAAHELVADVDAQAAARLELARRERIRHLDLEVVGDADADDRRSPDGTEIVVRADIASDDDDRLRQRQWPRDHRSRVPLVRESRCRHQHQEHHTRDGWPHVAQRWPRGVS
jgi:hypothetical protein